MRTFIEKNGFPPSQREIALHFNVYVHAVLCVLHAARRKGLVDWLEGAPRTYYFPGESVVLVPDRYVGQVHAYLESVGAR